MDLFNRRSGSFINHVYMEKGNEGFFSQMSILLHKPYLVKWSTKQRGKGVKMPKKPSARFMDGPMVVLIMERESDKTNLINYHVM